MASGSLQSVLDRIRGDIEGCYFTLCFEMESGLPLGMSTLEFAGDTENIGAAFGQVLDIVTRGQKHGRNKHIREELHTFREIIFETTKSTFVVMVPELGEPIAVGIGMPKEVKLGYARVAINKHRQALVESIKAIG
ncbi:MAG: hypothetical protein AAF447_03170 [Myxococcota bacterium]